MKRLPNKAFRAMVPLLREEGFYEHQPIRRIHWPEYNETQIQEVTETLKSLSNKYKVSKAMLLLNMHKLNYLKKAEYDEVLAKFNKEEIKHKKEIGKKSGGGISPEVRCLSEVGNKFVSLVANNYDREHITYTDALNYLSIKARSFDKVLSKAKK